MTEQKTIQAGLEIAHQWGPGATIAVLFLIVLVIAVGGTVWVVVNRFVKSDNNPLAASIEEIKKEIIKLRDRWHRHDEKFVALEISLRNKVDIENLESKVLSQIQSIHMSINSIQKDIESHLKQNQDILNVMKKHDDVLFGEVGALPRIRILESQLAKI